MKHTIFAAAMIAFSLSSCAQHDKQNEGEVVTQEELAQFDAQLEALKTQARAAYEKYGELPDTMGMRLEAEWDAIMQKRAAAQRQFVVGNKGTAEGAKMLLAYIRGCSDAAEIDSLVSLYAEMTDNDDVQKAQVIATGMKNKAIGASVVDLTMATPDGGTMSLTDVVGKGGYVLVDFWASWCGPCVKEMPNVVAEYNKYKSQGFEVIGVSLDQKKDAWQNAVKRLGMTWPQLSDLLGWKCVAAQLYGVQAIPSNILFDKDGKIIATDLTGKALQSRLAKIFNSAK